MRRLTATIATALTLLLVACGDDAVDGFESPADGAGDPTTAPSPAPDPSPTPAIAAGPEEDPRDVLNALAHEPEDPETELVYQHLPERFRVIDYGDDWVRSLATNLPSPEIVESIDQWELEEYEGYSLVRNPELFPVRWVFVLEDGRWRWDPGDLELLVAGQRARRGSLEGHSIGFGPDDDYDIRYEGEPDVGLLPPPVSGSGYGLGFDGDSVVVPMTWDVQPSRSSAGGDSIDSHLLADTRIPIDSISWRAGGETGSVEVSWTDAALSDDELVLHGWPDEETAEEAAGEAPMVPMLTYGATLRFDGVPDDAEEITLEFNDVTVGPFGDDNPLDEGDTIDYTFSHMLPAETTDPILVGEAPELADPDDTGDHPTPPAEADLPSAPEAADVLEIVEVEYETDDDSVDAAISLDRGDSYFEFPGPAQVTWDDGTVTRGSALAAGEMIEVTSERTQPPLDAEVSEVEFDQLVWQLGVDDATLHEDRIEAEWGDFPIIGIADEERIEYQPAGNRVIRSLTIEHEGDRISASGAGSGYDADFRPTDGQLEMGSGFEDAMGELPLPAEVEIWAAESGVVLEIE